MDLISEMEKIVYSVPLPDNPQNFIGAVRLRYLEDTGNFPAVATPQMEEALTNTYNEDTDEIVLTAKFDNDKPDRQKMQANQREYGLHIVVFSQNANPRINKYVIWNENDLSARKLRSLFHSRTDGELYPNSITIDGRLSSMPNIPENHCSATLTLKWDKSQSSAEFDTFELRIPVTAYRSWFHRRFEV